MLGDNIKRIRLEKGISTHKLSKLSKISVGYISELENNKAKNPSIEKLTAIADSLEVNVKDLLTNDEQLKYMLESNLKIYELASQALDKVSEKESSYSVANSAINKLISEFEDVDFSESEVEEIVNFVKYVISKRK